MPAGSSFPSPQEVQPPRPTPARHKVVRRTFGIASVVTLLIAAAGGLAFSSSSNLVVPKFQIFGDPSGAIANVNTGGPTISSTNAFFQSMGTNGRSCITCHQPSDAFSITPPHLQERFYATAGTDPVFRPVDGAT